MKLGSRIVGAETGLAGPNFRLFCLAALWLLAASLAPLTVVAAESAVESERQCMEQVRRTLIEKKLEQLDRETFQAIKGHCESGDTKAALALLEADGDLLQQCVREVNNRLKRAGQDVGQDAVRQAHAHCKRGDIEAAIEAIESAAVSDPVVATILSFTADRTAFQEGDSVTLSWKTADAAKVFLAREDRSAPTGMTDRRQVEANGSETVEPTGTSTYLLSAVGAGERPQLVQRKLEVQLDSAPNIFRFQANPATLRAGESAELSWDVYGAEQVRLDDQDVGARGDRTVKPTRKTYYKLTAWSATDRKAEETVAVSVSPFPPARLSSAVARIELCRDLETSGGSARCLSPDGPFWRADEVQVIVLFENLAPGRHTIERTFYRGSGFGTEGWQKLDSEDGGFDNPRQGDAVATFAIPRFGTGIQKLEIVLDGNPATRSEIKYCVECPGHDEW